MADRKYLFTSESVSGGHPDKLADQISDGVLDALLAQDPMSRVACETLVTTDFCCVAGEITSKAKPDFEKVVRQVIREVGYTHDDIGFNADTCELQLRLHSQSPDIAQGVNDDQSTGKDIGAGDQGLMFGYACNDTPELMPLPIALSHRITNALTAAREKKDVSWLRPDSKSQVTIEYEGFRPVRIDTVVVSTQHDETVTHAQIKDYVIEKIIKPLLPKDLAGGKIQYHINPTGKFVVGGPHGDTGLTGRKIIVDTYGGWGRHGGGAFSGKDPSKVDRSAAYMCRYIAKNIVAAGLAEVCEVQLSYAIGVAEPTSVLVDTQGTGTVSDEWLAKEVRRHFDLTPAGIIESLGLLKPIYSATATHGHFGRKPGECGPGTFTWEKTDKAAALAAAAKKAPKAKKA